MKRLLAYLFIVLGLGLTFSVNVKANLSVYDPNNFTKDGVLCLIKRINSNGYSYFYVDESEIYKLRNNKYNWQKILGRTNVKYPLTTQEKKELKFCDFKIYKSKNYDSFFALKKQWELTGGYESPSYISNKMLSRLVDKNLYAEITNDNNNQIVKAEPSQDLKGSELNKYKYNLQNTKTIPFLKISLNENIKNYNLDIPENNKVKYRQGDVTSYYIYSRQFDTNKNIFDDEYLKFSSISKDYTVPYRAIIINTDKKGKIYSILGYLYYKKFENNSFNKSEIENCDKYREPFISRNEIKLTANDLTSAYIYIEDIKNNNYYYKNALRKSVINDFSSTFGITCNYTIKPNKGETISDIQVSTMTADKQLEYWENNKGILISKFTGDDLINLTKTKDNKFSSYYDYLNYDYGFSSDKKTKVAKVEEPKQEEFKPKNKDIDNDAPVIEIAEAITVDSQAYTLKGKVKDKSQIYLTIDGRQVDVKKGKFELDRFNIDPDVAEEIKIVAIDKWNNRSEKTIKVTIDLKSTEIAKVYKELNPNNLKVKTDNNKIAIIIGIEKYENLRNNDAPYANRDAKAFRAYATNALGAKPSNIKMLIDDKATRSQALKAFKLWLPKIAGKGEKDIHIFFAGHGLASDNGEDLFLIPQDGESSLLEDTAISRVELISLIKKVNPKSVTMYFDTCYSGQTRDEKMLVASLRPLRKVADEQDTPDNFTIFTASNNEQTSGSIKEAKHGMFSYFLMRGMEGNADINNDKKITNGELISYLQDNVSQEAFTQNREQDPMLVGDPDKVLISYR